MRARDHTSAMLAWWHYAGIERADLALRRADGTMLWHRDAELDRLPLAWARRENAKGAEVYARPARGASWAMVFLDDLALGRAHRAADRYDALVVRTSPQGGCHLWLRTLVPLDEGQRRASQRYLAERTDADRASTSGEHLGRLGGFRNHKRGGSWVNTIRATRGKSPWQPPAPAPLDTDEPRHGVPGWGPTRGASTNDRSPSGLDWAWVREACERGVPHDVITTELVARCQARRGADAERYARYTVARATRPL